MSLLSMLNGLELGTTGNIDSAGQGLVLSAVILKMRSHVGFGIGQQIQVVTRTKPRVLS